MVRMRAVAVAATALVGLTGVAIGFDHVEQASASPQTARVALDSLEVKGRAPKTGYSRSQFGTAWDDNVAGAGGHNGCRTREDILRRDLTNIVLNPDGCRVVTGTLHDPYTGQTVQFVRGETTSAQVQIDHVVALSDAWQKGAQQWPADKRRDFANDPRNLQAVGGRVNLQKSDGDAATWLPPNKSYRCTYVERQIDVKRAYRLWVTQAEKDAMARVLASCGAGSGPTTSAPSATPQAPSPTPQSTPPPTAPSSGSTYYANCSAARAAGVAPIHRGQPGYRSGLDRDGDGIACE